jgi:predicted DCC family thiol-disulfide oxidoreductase YuxK
MGGTVLYDDTCNLCDGLVRFVKKRDKMNRFRFVPIQSEEGINMLRTAGLSDTDLNTAVYNCNGKYFLRSSAVLHILKDLGSAWRILYLFNIIPPFIRDPFYNLVAKNRYRIFGRKDHC